MTIPEYLCHFSNEGQIVIEVKFKDFDGTVTNMTMKAEEIDKIVDPLSGCFISEMTFDEWPFEVYKYEIDPLRKKLTIRARKIPKTRNMEPHL